jgi:hypothetical protein
VAVVVTNGDILFQILDFLMFTPEYWDILTVVKTLSDVTVVKSGQFGSVVSTVHPALLYLRQLSWVAGGAIVPPH